MKPKVFVNQLFWTKIYVDPQVFHGKIFFAPKFFFLNFVLHQKFLVLKWFGPTLLQTKNFVDKVIFEQTRFFEQNLIKSLFLWPRKNFGPKTYLEKNAEPQIF